MLLVNCKDDKRSGHYFNEKFDFLGFTFRPRLTKFREGKYGGNFSPAVSGKAAKTMRHAIRSWRFHRKSEKNLTDLSRMFNPVLRGWINYYGSYNKSVLYPICDQLNCALKQWAMRKFKTFRRKTRRGAHSLGRIARWESQLFAHWQLGWRPTVGR
jgi:RNA-directed DNA polymerase